MFYIFDIFSNKLFLYKVLWREDNRFRFYKGGMEGEEDNGKRERGFEGESCMRERERETIETKRELCEKERL